MKSAEEVGREDARGRERIAGLPQRPIREMYGP